MHGCTNNHPIQKKPPIPKTTPNLHSQSERLKEFQRSSSEIWQGVLQIEKDEGWITAA
jgi:hypothetical protein